MVWFGARPLWQSLTRALFLPERNTLVSDRRRNWTQLILLKSPFPRKGSEHLRKRLVHSLNCINLLIYLYSYKRAWKRKRQCKDSWSKHHFALIRLYELKQFWAHSQQKVASAYAHVPGDNREMICGSPYIMDDVHIERCEQLSGIIVASKRDLYTETKLGVWNNFASKSAMIAGPFFAIDLNCKRVCIHGTTQPKLVMLCSSDLLYFEHTNETRRREKRFVKPSLLSPF